MTARATLGCQREGWKKEEGRHGEQGDMEKGELYREGGKGGLTNWLTRSMADWVTRRLEGRPRVVWGGYRASRAQEEAY
jgi:hypothetical protein